MASPFGRSKKKRINKSNDIFARPGRPIMTVILAKQGAKTGVDSFMTNSPEFV